LKEKEKAIMAEEEVVEEIMAEAIMAEATMVEVHVEAEATMAEAERWNSTGVVQFLNNNNAGYLRPRRKTRIDADSGVAL
jgi:hypothetical protein